MSGCPGRGLRRELRAPDLPAGQWFLWLGLCRGVGRVSRRPDLPAVESVRQLCPRAWMHVDQQREQKQASSIISCGRTGGTTSATRRIFGGWNSRKKFGGEHAQQLMYGGHFFVKLVFELCRCCVLEK